MSEEETTQEEAIAEIRSEHPGDLDKKVVEALREIYDPEIPVNIYDIGLIYNIDISKDAKVDIKMTLTSPMCPVADSLPPEVENRVAEVEGVEESKVEVIWDPPWTMEKMNEAAKLQLGLI
ncbi:MAG TPA: SUF system Fe-S cluster assembly protein [Acidobacteriota bacterium]|nr:SUF system Fe-S cluster assembly protein [Acidobacteriota bacterium]